MLFGLAVILAAISGTATAHAAVGPHWDVRAIWGDTNLPPGGEGQFELQVRNVGDESAEEALTITDQLPAGVTATDIQWHFVTMAFESSGATYSLQVDLTEFCTGNGPGAAPSIVGATAITCVLPKEKPVTCCGGHSGTVHPVAELSKPLPLVGEFGYLPQILVDVAIGPLPPANPGTNKATVSGGGGPVPFSDEDQVPFGSTPAPFGVRSGSLLADDFTAAYPFGSALRTAGAHPFEQRVDFELDQRTGLGADGTRYLASAGLLKTAEVTLPRGMIGNPEALPKCDPTAFAESVASKSLGALGGTACPPDTQVGYISVWLQGGTNNFGRGGAANPNIKYVPIYNLVPPKGTPVDLAFNAVVVQAHIFAALDPAQNYAIKSVTPNVNNTLRPVRAVEATLWGVPGDPAHDRFRFNSEGVPGASFDAPIHPFYTNPADCGFDNGGHRIQVESYTNPGPLTAAQEYPDPMNVSGCDDPRFRFEPDIVLQPTSRAAGAPTGLDVHLEVPQRSDEVENASDLYAQSGKLAAIATPPLKKAVVTFPEGMTINPSAAQGLASCAPDQVKLGTNEPVTCPDASQYGTLTLHTPILPENVPMKGFVYIAKQNDNPFHNFLSLYLVIEEPDRGILVKIPGRLDLDPNTGQITTSFDELPQFPVSDMQMTLKGGVRAGLVQPTTCGTKTISAEFFTWQDPSTPHVVTDSYGITQKPDGSPCVNSLAERPFRPSLTAGTLNPTAGAYSPFAMRLTRSDEDQEFSQLGVTLPPGLAAKFAGVGICPEGGIAQALARETVAGDGALEQTDPSCPASSLIGTTEVGTGVGVPLTYVPGKVYLSGPYRGAPISLVVISPAIVGPYDLGVITVRTALNVNPVTAQGEATSDPLPQIFQGIPVRIRDIRLSLDRPDFTLNPTSCAEKQIEAKITGTGGNLASTVDDTASNLTNRFQAADCASLNFKPKLSFHLYGGTHRGAHPKLKAVLRARPGDANIAAASVALPHSEFLDQAHIKTVCTRVQFAAHECPAASIYGYAVAKTPLFGQPLEGPVYLRSSSHKLPDLVAALKGPASQPVEVDLDGRIDSINGGIRNSFEIVPDAPVESFILTMQGGNRGLLQNSVGLCSGTFRATAKFSAQNGKAITLHPAMRSACGKVRQQAGHHKR